MSFSKRKSNERGFSLVEIIIVIAIIAGMTAIIGPKALEAQAKSKSNGLKDEFSTMISAFTTLNTSGGSAIHAIKVDINDENKNKVMTDYVVPIAPSSAFGTVTKSEVFRRTSASAKPIELSYGLNQITVESAVKYTGSVRHTGALNEQAVPFTGTTTKATVNASSMSSQGATGIAPIFSLNETKMLEDFVISPNGLNWAEFQSQLGSPENVLATIFGGPTTNSAVSYYPYDPVKEQTGAELVVTKAPVELTLVDIDAVEASSSGSSLSILTDASRGACYQVTSLMSRQDFVNYVTKGAGAKLIVKKGAGSTSGGGGGGGGGGGSTALTEDVANKMYDKLEEGFIIGNPVFIPHREKDIIKSTDSDLKNGFYRP